MGAGSSDGVPPAHNSTDAAEQDLEAQKIRNNPAGTSEVTEELKEIRLSFKDINPIGPILLVLSRRNNLAILFSSGRCRYLLVCDLHSFCELHRFAVRVQLFLGIYMLSDSCIEVWLRCVADRSGPPCLRDG